MFNKFKGIFTQFKNDAPLLLPKEIDNGAIEQAGNEAASASMVASNAAAKEGQVIGRSMSNAARTASQIAIMDDSTNHYLYSAAIQHANEIERSALSTIKSSHSAVDTSTAKATALAQLAGLRKQIAPSLPKEYQQQFDIAANSSGDAIDTEMRAQNGKIAFNMQYASYSGKSIDTLINSVKQNYTGASSKAQKQAALMPYEKALSSVSTLEQQAYTPSQIASLQDAKLKLMYLTSFIDAANNLDAHVNNNSADDLLAMNVSSENDNQKLHSFKQNLYDGGNYKVGIMSLPGKKVDEGINSANVIVPAIANLRNHRDSMQLINHYINSGNPDLKQMGTYYQKQIMNGQGANFIMSIAPNSEVTQSYEKYLKLPNGSTPQEKEVKFAAYNDYKSKLVASAAYYGISTKHLDTIPMAQEQEIDNLPLIEKDSKGNVIDINTSTFNPRQEQVFRQLWGNMQFSTVLGDTFAAHVSKFAAFLPRVGAKVTDRQGMAITTASFLPSVQQYAEKNSETAFLGKDLKPQNTNYKNYNQLYEHILLNPDNYNLKKLSTLTDINEPALAKYMATRITLQAMSGVTLDQAVKNAKGQATLMLTSHPTYNGQAGGMHYALSPALTQKMLPGKTDYQIPQIISLAASDTLKQKRAGIAVAEPMDGTGKPLPDTKKKEWVAVQQKNVIGEDSNWSIITSNGGVKLKSTTTGQEYPVPLDAITAASHEYDRLSKSERDEIYGIVDEKNIANNMLYKPYQNLIKPSQR